MNAIFQNGNLESNIHGAYNQMGIGASKMNEVEPSAPWGDQAFNFFSHIDVMTYLLMGLCLHVGYKSLNPGSQAECNECLETACCDYAACLFVYAGFDLWAAKNKSWWRDPLGEIEKWNNVESAVLATCLLIFLAAYWDCMGVESYMRQGTEHINGRPNPALPH